MISDQYQRKFERASEDREHELAHRGLTKFEHDPRGTINSLSFRKLRDYISASYKSRVLPEPQQLSLVIDRATNLIKQGKYDIRDLYFMAADMAEVGINPGNEFIGLALDCIMKKTKDSDKYRLKNYVGILRSAAIMSVNNDTDNNITASARAISKKIKSAMNKQTSWALYDSFARAANWFDIGVPKSLDEIYKKAGSETTTNTELRVKDMAHTVPGTTAISEDALYVRDLGKKIDCGVILDETPIYIEYDGPTHFVYNHKGLPEYDGQTRFVSATILKDDPSRILLRLRSKDIDIMETFKGSAEGKGPSPKAVRLLGEAFDKVLESGPGAYESRYFRDKLNIFSHVDVGHHPSP